MAAWQQSSDGKWTWNKTANPDPALEKLWGHGAMIDPSQDPTGVRNHGAWTVSGGRGYHWTWGADPDPDLLRSYSYSELTDPDHFPNLNHGSTDINKPPPTDVPAPTLTDIWHGVAPDVTGGPPVTPNGAAQQVTSPPVHGPFIVYPGAIRDAEQGVLTTIDQTIPHYDTLKAAVSDAPHQNVYQSGTQQELNNAQDHLLLRIGDSIELAGQYTQALNNAAQMYARADIDSFLPTMSVPEGMIQPK